MKAELKRLIPGFHLKSVKGEMVSPWDYKEKHNLVILFFNPRNGADLETIAGFKQRYHELTDENAEVLAVATGPFEELEQCVASMDFPFPLLSDEKGEVHEAYGVSTASVFVADKFGMLKMMAPITVDTDAVLDVIVDTLDLVELECPECGISAWPEDQMMGGT